MSNFKVIQMGERHWAVFIVNPNEANDRYMLTSPLDTESEAENLRSEFERIEAERKPSIPLYDVDPVRCITFGHDDDFDELGNRSENEP